MNPDPITRSEISDTSEFHIDWHALWLFHVERSQDETLPRARRLWHEAQSLAVRARHLPVASNQPDFFKLAVIAIVDERRRSRYARTAHGTRCFDWSALCREAQRAASWHGTCDARARARV